MKRVIALTIIMATLCISLGGVFTFAEEEKLVVDKTEYTVGEAITVSAKGSGKDWVGIYYPDAKNSLYWAYIDPSADKGVGSGVAFDISKAPKKNSNAPATLPAGDYIIRLMPNDTSDLTKALATVKIKIKADANAPTSGGDLTKLNVPKTEYGYNEKINISAIGSGKDWVGIYYPTGTRSLYWAYIDSSASKGVGSGVEFDIKTAPNRNSDAPSKFPAGKYIIRLMPDDTSDLSKAVAWVEITVKEPDPSEIVKPAKPLSAEYVLKNNTDGFSEGTLTVNTSKDNIAKDIVCYWADSNGKLEGYTALAKFKVTGETTVRDIPANILIPTGATKLLVYTALDGILSEECVEIKLPEGAASKDFGKPIIEFQVVSDVHITTNNDHRNNKHYVEMLKDIVKISPESIGLFIAGDMANTGNKQEYENLVSLHASVKGSPAYYLAIGNHDLFNGTLENKTAQFLNYAKLPDGTNPKSVHYDFWLEGYHCVFLGNDKLVGNNRVTLNDETLEWLDETLAKDRVEGKPIFLFIHQSIYNTIAGSLPGQGWDGVENFTRFNKVLKKYPEVLMFNGHSHWTLDSEKCMYDGGENFPNIFNTASVAYLWTSYDVQKGENLEGSQGYYIRVYEDKTAVLGRDFTTGEWVASAQFISEYKTNGNGSAETTDAGDATVPNGEISFAPEESSGSETQPEKSFPIVPVTVAVVAVAAVAAAIVITVVKKKK